VAPEPPVVTRPADLPDDIGERAYAHVEALVALGARHTGSPGWSSALDYIAATLHNLGLAVRRDRWQDPDEDLWFENVHATVGGRGSARIVLAAHHDTKRTSGHPDPEHNFEFVGANDSGSGVGLLLALAAHLAEHPPATTVELVFFDGEESIPFDWDLERALFGSRRYVETYQREREQRPDTPAIAAMILLDMVGARDLQIDEETKSDASLRAVFRAAAKAVGHDDVFFFHRHAVTDDHVPFLDAGIPAIDLIDLYDNPQWHTPDDTLEHISARSLQKVGEVVLTALPVVARRFADAAEDR
jgi:Zn-dependent M28 family amino/carboxypeptidase